MRMFRLTTLRGLLAILGYCSLALAIPGNASAASPTFDSSLGPYTFVYSADTVPSEVYNYAAVLQFSSNVTVSQIGVYTSVDNAQDIKFLVFDSLYPLNVGGTGNLLLSSQKSFAQNPTQTFIYSDPISFTFLAGRYYDVGILGSTGTLTPASLTGAYGWPESYTQNGITELAANATLLSFTAPTTGFYTDPGVAPFIQLVAAPVPEPETYAMMLAGLGLMGFVARRRKQKNGA